MQSRDGVECVSHHTVKVILCLHLFPLSAPVELMVDKAEGGLE